MKKTTPRLKLTPAEERAADVMEWLHDQLLWAALAVRADRNPATMASLAAIALLERMALPSAILDPADPVRLFMHDDEGDR